MVEDLIEEKPKKLTPDEVELASFEERKRLQNVRVKLNEFRKGNSIFATPKHMDIFENDGTLFPKSNKGTLFPKKKKKKNNGSIMNNSSMMNNKSLFMK